MNSLYNAGQRCRECKSKDSQERMKSEEEFKKATERENEVRHDIRHDRRQRDGYFGGDSK